MLGNQPTLPTATTVIGRLRVRANARDSLLTQMRIGRLLDPIELQPRQLPSSAILYIRMLRDPLPGSLRLENGDVRPQLAWQEALSATLERMASKAVRPARETVPPSAEAVVFIDRSELLSCLASDWCEGSMMTRWWWQSLLKQGAATQIVKDLWRREPQYVPAALQQLARKNRATDFVRALSDSEACELLRGVTRSFALPALASVLDNFETSANTGRSSLDLNPPTTAARRSNRVTTPPAGPWRQWVPECDAAELRPEQELLFGMSLMLQRAPVKARAPEFHARVKDWQQRVSQVNAGNFVVVAEQASDRRTAALVNEETGSRRAAPTVSESDPTAPVVSEFAASAVTDQADSPSLPAEQADDNRRRDRQTSGPTETFASPSSVGEQAESPLTAATDSRTWKYESEASAKVAESRVGPAVLPVAQNAAALSDPYERFLSQAAEASPPSLTEAEAESEGVEEWVGTGLGGVFYLINLGLFLGLYGDFTTPAEPGIQLNIWDFVALLGRELAGEEIESDDVWPLLERLAQREAGDPIGSGFEEEVLSFEFSVLSSEPDEGPRPAELRTRNSELKTENSKLKTPAAAAVADWVERLMPYVRTRLRQALGLSEDDDPGPIVCRHQARVCVTPTHLDVFFSLAELPIAIRLSGLDRDPGWVPAAGKFIAFHFE
jgi:hypothetical protein